VNKQRSVAAVRSASLPEDVSSAQLVSWKCEWGMFTVSTRVVGS
jgi:hypothetical protein